MRKDLKSNEIQEVTQNQESADMHTKPKRSKKIYAIIASALAFVLLIGGTFAYFTDYATLQTTGTAGTVKIAVDDNINLLNEDGYDILNPGDMRDAGFTVTNEGNKSVDVKGTIFLTGYDRDGNLVNFTGDAETQSEYDLYLRDDVELVEGRGYMPKEGAKPLQVKEVDGGFIMYTLPDLMLNGNSALHDEVETIDGVNEYSHEYDIVLVFKGAAGNEWQASQIYLEVMVDAKQHENTEGGWETIYGGEEGITLELVKRSTYAGCPYFAYDADGGLISHPCEHINENINATVTCRYLNCECEHAHVTETVGDTTYVYCEDVDYVHMPGWIKSRVIFVPYEAYEYGGTHNHAEIPIGNNVTHIYCEYVEDVHRDGDITWYPWELYF